MIKPIAISEDVLRIESGEPVLLSFLIYYDERLKKYFIKSLDFSVDSEGDSIEECQANIREAIQIHLEDCEVGANIFDPAAKTEWDTFVDSKIRKEQQAKRVVAEKFRFDGRFEQGQYAEIGASQTYLASISS